MTYCVGLKLNEGIVLLSDTRTNAGIDNVSRYRKMFTWEVPGDRAIALMTSGNLSITQGVIARLERTIEQAEITDDKDAETIAREAMAIAADICVYTNGRLTVETING